MPQLTTIKLTSSSYMHGDACTCKTITLQVNKSQLKALWSTYGKLGFEQMEVIK